MKVKIQRARCRDCNGNFSFLYDFLIPRCKFTVQAVEEAVVNYLTEPNSYLAALTMAVSEGATLFRMLENFLANLPAVWMWMAKQLIASGQNIESLKEESRCPNGSKCRKNGKSEALNWGAGLLKVEMKIFQLASANGFPLFSREASCGMKRTHWAECKLF